MCVRNKIIGGFVHGYVTVQTKTQQANVDRAIGSQPTINPRAFPFAVSIAPKALESPGIDVQRANQFGLKVAAASRRMAGRQAAPFVDLQNTQLAKLPSIQ